MQDNNRITVALNTFKQLYPNSNPIVRVGYGRVIVQDGDKKIEG